MSTPAAIFNKDVEISGNSDLIIKSGGNLGIGKTPSSQIDVSGSGNFSESLTVQNTKIGGNYPNFASFAHSSNNDSNNYSLLQSGSGKTFLNASSDQSIAFSINHTEKMVLDKDGNIGIGKTNPSTKLDVDGSGNFSGNLAVSGTITGDLTGDVTGNASSATELQTARTIGGISFDGTSNIDLSGVNQTGNQDIKKDSLTFTSTNGPMSFRQAGNAEIMRLTQGKNVGIGTNNPSTKLDVDGSGNFSGNLNVDGSLNIGSITDVESYVSDISTNLSNLSQNKIENGTSNVTVESSNGPISFDTNGSEKMKILTNGNVGIGTNNPSTKLDVDGSGNFSGNMDICGNVKIGPNGTYADDSSLNTSLLIHEPGIGKEAARDTGTIMLTHQNVSGHSSIVFRSGNSGAHHGKNDYGAIDYTSNEGGNTNKSVLRIISNNDNTQSHEDNIALTTNNTDRLTVQGDGNVGIGTTNPSVELDVSGDGKFSGDLTIDGSLNIHDGLKVYYDSGISANQILSSGKSLYLKSVSGYTSQLQLQPSVVKIFSNRFVYGVDQTLIANSGKLDISGDVSFSGDLTVDGSLNIGAITDVETYVNDISTNLSNLSQDKIENGNSNVTVESSNGPISFDTNGSERMKILTNGNVGIGTNPSTNLDVSGSIKISGDDQQLLTNIIRASYAGNTFIENNHENIYISTKKNVIINEKGGGNGDTMTIDCNNKRVGIGKTPSKELDVNGTIRANAIDCSNNGNFIIKNDASNNSIIFRVHNDVEALRIRHHKDTGYGYLTGPTISNTTFKDIDGTDRTNQDLNNTIRFGGVYNGVNFICDANDYYNSGTLIPEGFNFFGENKGADSSRLLLMYIQGETGNVGIKGQLGVGVDPSNSNYNLDVSGDGNFSGDLDICGNVKIGPNGTYSSYGNLNTSLLIHEPGMGKEAARDTGTIMLSHQDVSGHSSIVFRSGYHSSSSGSHDYAAIDYTSNEGGSNNSILRIISNKNSSGINEDKIIFTTNIKDRLTVRGNGYIGIGITDPGKILDVSGDGRFSGDLNVTGTISGSLSASNITGTLLVSKGGTGATSASGARTNLGLGTSNAPQFASLGLGKASDSDYSLTVSGEQYIQGNNTNDPSTETQADLERGLIRMNLLTPAYATSDVDPSGDFFQIRRVGSSGIWQGKAIMNISNVTSSSHLTKLGFKLQSHPHGKQIDGTALNQQLYTIPCVMTGGNRVGIGGTTNPSVELDVSGDGKFSGDLDVGGIIKLGDSNKIIGKDQHHAIHFTIGGDFLDFHEYGTIRFFTDGHLGNQTEKMCVLQNGNVGIGSTNPSTNLDVSGDGKFSGDLDVTGTISGSLNASNITGTLSLTNGGTGATSASGAITSLGLGTTNTPQFSRLGLGEASNSSFSLNASDSIQSKENLVLKINGGSNDVDNTNSILFQNTGSYYSWRIGRRYDSSRDDSGDGSLIISGGDSKSSYEDLTDRLTLSSNGNVGIGTNPSTNLDVSGSIKISGDDQQLLTNIIRASYAGNTFIENNHENIYISTKKNVIINEKGGGNGDTMTIDCNNKRVGIGKTPSKELDVSGDGKFSGDLDVGGKLTVDPGSGEQTTSILAKGSADPNFKLVTIQDTYSISNGGKIGGIGVNYKPDSDNYDVASIRFLRGSGAQKGYITFSSNNTELMRINGSGGNVGIGTTNPLQKLHVNGTIRANAIDCSNNSDFIIKNDASHNSIIFRVHNDVEALRIRHNKTTECGYLTGPEIPSITFTDIEGTARTNQKLNNSIRFGTPNSGVNFICDTNSDFNADTVVPEGFNFFREFQQNGVTDKSLLMYIQGETGNVGIKGQLGVGVDPSNSNYNLDVNGDGKFSGDLTVNGIIEGGASRIIPATTSDNADYYLIFNVSTNQKRQPKTNSNIKVNPFTGTLSVKALNILDGVDGVYKFITSNGSGTDLSKDIDYSYLDLNHNNFGYRIGGSHRSGDGGIFTLESNYNNNYTERFRIDHNGKVGIGSTNPSVELDVIGDGKFSGDLDVTGTITGDLTGNADSASNINVTNETANTNHYLLFVDGASNGNKSAQINSNIKVNPNTGKIIADNTNGGFVGNITNSILKLTSSGNLNLESGSSNAIIFKAGGSIERMRIKNNGNVGIGTTNPSKELEVIGDINFTGDLYKNGTPFSGSIWNMTGNRIYYDTDNVGIGTTNPNHAQLQIRKDAIIGEQNVNIDITSSSAFSNSFTQPTALSINHLADSKNITSDGVGLTSNNADSTNLRGYTYFQITSNNSVHKVFYNISDASKLNLQNQKSYVIKFTFFSDKSSSSISNQDIAQYYFLEESSEITNFSSFSLSNETVKIGLDETKRVVHSFYYDSSKYYYIVFSAAGSGSSWEDIVIAWDDLSIEPYNKILTINGKTEISSITNERGQGAPLKLRNNNVTSNLDQRNLNYNHNNVLQMERAGLSSHSHTLSAYMALNRGNSSANAHLIFKVNSHRNASSANEIASTYRNDFDNAIPLTMTGCGISGETYGYVGVGDYFIPTEALEVSGNAKIHHGHLEVVNGSYNFITSTDTGSEYVTPHNLEPPDVSSEYDMYHSYLDLNHNNYGYRIGGSDLSGIGGVFTLSDNYNGTYTERFRIDSSGNVGVGTKAPYFPMHVYTSTLLGFNDSDFAVVDFVDDTAISGRKYGVLSSTDHRHFENHHVDRILRVIAMNKIAQDSDHTGNNNYGAAESNVGVGEDTDANTGADDNKALVVPQIGGADTIQYGISLLTHGTIYSKTNIIYASDERIKTNITDISDNEALNIFRQIRPVTYNYIDTEKRGNNKIYGFLAQEIKQILPHAVNINENEYIPNIYKIANYNSETKQLHFFSDISCDIDFNRNENDISYVNLKLYSMKNNDVFGEEFSVKCLHQIDSRTLQLHDDINVTPYTLYDSSRNVLTDVSGNRYENLIFVFGQEIFDFNSLNKSAIWTITTAATQEIDRQLVDAKAQIETQKTQIETQKTQIETQKTQIETLTNLIETLTKRVELLEQN